MYINPKYCWECQVEDPCFLTEGSVKLSWGPATYACKTRCGRRVCGTRHPLLTRGSPVQPGQPAGKCRECDYQDYLHSPGGM